MIKNLQMFNPNGTVLAYKNPAGKGSALVEFAVAKCLEQGRLANKKLVVASTAKTAVKFAKACKSRNIQFLPIIGTKEDAEAISELQGLGITPDRTPLAEKSGRIAELQAQGWYYFDQHSDALMIDYYKNEAAKSLSELGSVRPDIFVDFVGTGATLRGFYEALKGICPCAFTNSYLKDENKLAKKAFVRDIIKNNEVTYLSVQAESAEDLLDKYSKGVFGQQEPVERGFFASLQAGLSWLQNNPGKTVLLYWED